MGIWFSMSMRFWLPWQLSYQNLKTDDWKVTWLLLHFKTWLYFFFQLIFFSDKKKYLKNNFKNLIISFVVNTRFSTYYILIHVLEVGNPQKKIKKPQAYARNIHCLIVSIYQMLLFFFFLIKSRLFYGASHLL